MPFSLQHVDDGVFDVRCRGSGFCDRLYRALAVRIQSFFVVRSCLPFCALRTACRAAERLLKGVIFCFFPFLVPLVEFIYHVTSGGGTNRHARHERNCHQVRRAQMVGVVVLNATAARAGQETVVEASGGGVGGTIDLGIESNGSAARGHRIVRRLISPRGGRSVASYPEG